MKGTFEDLRPDELLVENLALQEDLSVKVEVVNVLLLCGVQTSARILLRLTVHTDEC